MADHRQKANADGYLSTNHVHRPSADTTASGIAESAISYSAFPEPPSSIPTTPVVPFIPSVPRYGSPQPAAASILSSDRFSHSTFASPRRDGSVGTSEISPYDWHEGASSIDVDPTEDRLLPTSFITNLLRENAGPRGARSLSFSSDAISGISEMTYPPRYQYTDSLHDNNPIPSSANTRRQSHRGFIPHPIGGRSPSSRTPGPNISGPGRQGFDEGTADSSRPGHTSKYTRSSSLLGQSNLITEQPELGRKYGSNLSVYNEAEENDDGKPGDTHARASSTHPVSLAKVAPRTLRPNATTSTTRESIHSNNSAAPSIISSIRRVLTWKKKPLPSIPRQTVVTSKEHRDMEDATPLPELVSRADRLQYMLEKGYHPHHSVSSYAGKSEQFTSSFSDAGTTIRHEIQQPHKKLASPGSVSCVRNRKYWIIIGIFVVGVGVGVGIAVGVTRRARVRRQSCSANMGGVSCNLNATCICTTTTSPCNPIARSIMDIIPVMNELLSVNMTTSTVYNSLWRVQGSVQGADCIPQVSMIDVSSVLDDESHGNRTRWSQVALLWTLVQTWDSSVVEKLQNFIEKAPWSQIWETDGPVSSSGSVFITRIAGFEYNFAAQTIIPVPVTFVDQGMPQNEQVSKLSNIASSSLDRMYSYAVASSKQQENALMLYWTNVLHQQQANLKAFKAGFSSSPIILPFDGTSPFIRNLHGANTSDSFPPPIACYPDLGLEHQQAIATLEETVFMLSPAANTPQFNSSCVPLHPTYGFLDVLRMRLPFLDSRRNVARQGVILNSDAAPRVILAVGEVLGSLPGSTNATRSLSLLEDPRSYGTISHADHIILQYLSSMSANTANAVINHVLHASTSISLPPDQNDTNLAALFPLESIPVIEIAAFGSIDESDVKSIVTSFTTPTGSLFFGSTDGNSLRTWAIGKGKTIAWAENSIAPEVVYDDTFADNVFNLTWNAASTAIATNALNVGVANITNAFRDNQRFRP